MAGVSERTMSSMKRPLVFLFSILLISQNSHAVLAPYENDYSSTGLPNQNGTWSLNAGQYRNTLGSGTNVSATSSVSITNLDGIAFVMSSQFTINSTATLASNSSFTVGFGSFSTTSNFSSGSAGQNYYLSDFTYTGQGTSNPQLGTLRILSLGDSPDGFTSVSGSAIVSGASTNFAILTGTTYTLKLTGTVSNGTLSLAFGLYDAAGTTQIGTSATATDTTPLTGDYFGYRNRTGGNTSSSTQISFDNFSVVPEPGTGVSLTLALTGVIYLFRRRESKIA